MSFHERKNKRKTVHNGQQDRTSFKPSASFTPTEGGRDWTVSVAIPTSILTNLATADQRMSIPGRIARALAVFAVDEVVVFDDSPASSRPRQTDTAGYTGDTDPAHFLTHILSFLEAPPFMRKALFPLHPNLRLTALLPSLDMPHHPNPKEWIPYREGVTVPGKTSTGSGTLVEVGLDEPVEIEEDIPPKSPPHPPLPRRPVPVSPVRGPPSSPDRRRLLLGVHCPKMPFPQLRVHRKPVRGRL
ncbi:hypothetical protein J3458_019673 [Metarhizium acridum]|uniref:uncharacterized protein n=1 Tax=Metarhizium acridum TaxID=92637 RepID=UPI001C6D0060|nr:hypothetical protein J3458_019673 [Metarhizium acridum]